MTSTELDYELAVKGNNFGAVSYSGTGSGSEGYIGTALSEMSSGALDGKSGSYFESGSNTSGTYYATGAGKDAIRWRLSSEYNRYEDGLGPDSHGSFTFYVVPRKSGDIKIKVSLSIDGFTANVKKNEDNSFHVENLRKLEPGNEGYEVVAYLNSHILFFTGRTGTGSGADPYYYNGLIDDKLEMSFTNCKENELIPVTIYWIWPKTFAQMACVAESGNLANPSGTTADTSTVTALRQYMVDNSTEILKDITKSKAMEYMATSGTSGSGTVYTFNRSLVVDNLTTLSTGYNKADQSIGTTIKYFLVVLTAE